MKFNRRGFMAAMFAAPLAALGNFAGNHNLAGSGVELTSDCHIGEPSSFTVVTDIWTNLYPDSPWVHLQFSDGRIIRYENWDKIPFHPMGNTCW